MTLAHLADRAQVRHAHRLPAAAGPGGAAYVAHRGWPNSGNRWGRRSHDVPPQARRCRGHQHSEGRAGRGFAGPAERRRGVSHRPARTCSAQSTNQRRQRRRNSATSLTWNQSNSKSSHMSTTSTSAAPGRDTSTYGPLRQRNDQALHPERRQWPRRRPGPSRAGRGEGPCPGTRGHGRGSHQWRRSECHQPLPPPGPRHVRSRTTRTQSGQRSKASWRTAPAPGAPPSQSTDPPVAEPLKSAIRARSQSVAAPSCALRKAPALQELSTTCRAPCDWVPSDPAAADRGPRPALRVPSAT